MENKLLSRQDFKNAVFARDHHTCVFCQKPAADAHHIFDRKLFPDGGYYLNNGASVCEEHHLACEQTRISIQDVQGACGILELVMPPGLEATQAYDKWGNLLLSNGSRVRGSLFSDPGVQKVLEDGGVLTLFSHKVKYPRTWHMPDSPGATTDDKRLAHLTFFENQSVVITEKMDGENTTLYRTELHARSIDSGFSGHPSRDWVKAFHNRIALDIPEGWRICGENLYAKHSIAYSNLKSFFYGFSIWNTDNVCLSWEDTLEWFELLGIVPVPTVYRGTFDMGRLHKLCRSTTLGGKEGVVMRLTDAFPYAKFSNSVAKYVRANHVQTDRHWRGAPLSLNGLESKGGSPC